MRNKTSYIAILFLIFNSCNFDHKDSVQVSLTLQEAKAKGVFISQFKVGNIQQLNSAFAFPIRSAWEESDWHLALDEKGNESYKISKQHHHLVFDLQRNDSLTERTFYEGKWVMFEDNTHTAVASIRGMINISLSISSNRDSLSFSIYKENSVNNINENLTPLFKFNLLRLNK